MIRMELLTKSEERFLTLLTKQNWDTDIHAYFKLCREMDQELKTEYDSLVAALMGKGYIKQKYIRKFILAPEAYTYFKDKKQYQRKKLWKSLTPWLIAAIGWILAIIGWFVN